MHAADRCRRCCSVGVLLVALAAIAGLHTAPARVYRHEWSVGDTVIWDNTGVVHRAAPYAPDSPRELLRTTVFGDEPIQ